MASDNTVLYDLLERQRKRMGKKFQTELDEQQFHDEMANLALLTRHMESDDKNDAIVLQKDADGNPITSAKGAYQFVDAAVDTGKQRALNRGVPEDYVNDIPQDPREWSPEQGEVMFIANMFSQTGSDAVLAKVATGDMDAYKEAYSRFHHTNPDEATLKRMEIFFPTSTENT